MVSEVAITTKTERDDVSMTYTVNHNGDVISTKPSHLGQGKVSAVDLPDLQLTSLSLQLRSDLTLVITNIGSTSP